MAKKGQLVSQFFERVSAEVFVQYLPLIKNYLRKRHGLYALYKGERLYYVGLASNLNARLKQHKRDRHQNKWDSFSVYLTIGDSHLKEIESLVLRISKPQGNAVKGKLIYAQNLQRQLRRDFIAQSNQQAKGMFSSERKAKLSDTYNKKGRVPILYQYRDRKEIKILRATFKGKKLRARVLSDGRIRYNKEIFTSPSLAAAKACGRKTENGWTFWKYERAPGDWVRLSRLKK